MSTLLTLIFTPVAGALVVICVVCCVILVLKHVGNSFGIFLMLAIFLALVFPPLLLIIAVVCICMALIAVLGRMAR